MNGAANGSLASDKNTVMVSRIPTLFGKASKKQPLNGRNSSIPPEGSDDQPINGYETNHHPMKKGNTTNEPMDDNISNDVINGTNGVSECGEKDIKFDVIVTMDTDGSDNDSNGMPWCLAEKFRHRSGTMSSTDGETPALNGVHVSNGDPNGVDTNNGMPEYLKEKFRHRSGTMSSTDGETVDLNGIHTPNGEPNGVGTNNGMPEYLTEKFRHRNGTMSSTDGETVDFNGVSTPNGDPKGVDHNNVMPMFLMEKIRHRSGGTVTDDNGDLSENVGFDGVVAVDIGGVGENKKVLLRKRNTSGTNGVDIVERLDGKPTETTNNNDENVEKNVGTTNRKSKLPTVTKTSFVRRLANRLSSDERVESPDDDERRARNKSPESKIPVSMVTKSTRKSPTVHVQQYSYFERKFVTRNDPDDNDNDYDAEDELDLTFHKSGQKVKAISNLNGVNGNQQNGEIQLTGQKIKDTHPPGGLKLLMMHKGEAMNNGCQQEAVIKSEQWCNGEANYNTSGTGSQQAQGRTDCVAEKQNAFNGIVTDAYKQEDTLYAMDGNEKGQGENVHHPPPFSNCLSHHKLVKNHSQSQCVQKFETDELKQSPDSQNNVHSNSSTTSDKEDLDNLENLESEFMKALDAFVPLEPDVMGTGSVMGTGNPCLNQNEVSSVQSKPCRLNIYGRL